MDSLFDEPETPRREWHEVSQAKFLAWPERQQLAYCAARDRDSEVYVNTPDAERAFYRERAESYERMVNGASAES